MAKKKVTAYPELPGKHRVEFTLDAPQAQRVQVTGTFCDWETNSYALKRGKTGIWSTTLSLPSGRHEYRFLVDGEWRDDPNCAERVPNSFGTENCVLHVLRDAADEVRSAVASEGVP
jgi:1,4-alpha-glucan branching enzyme